MKNLLWMLTDPAGDAKEDLTKVFYDNVWPWVQTILWILVAALAVVLIVKGITTALAVVKAADEPQVRQEKIGAFKYLAIGLGIAIVIVALANVIVDLVLKNATASDVTSGASSFLF